MPATINNKMDAFEQSKIKIIEQKIVEIDSILKESIECHKIIYRCDGLRVVGFIVKEKAIKHSNPVLIFNRAGNRDVGKISTRTLKYLSALAIQGYVILATQYRGNDGGEGQEEFGGVDINDVLALINLAGDLPCCDNSKIGMLGYSRGGLMTYLAMKMNAPLKACAVVGAPSDLFATYDEREDLRKDLELLIGDNPENKRAAYEARSAFYWPDKLNVPLLILHGSDDWRVNVGQSEKLADRLKELDKEHVFIQIKESDHNLSRHREKRNQLILNWFNKYLK